MRECPASPLAIAYHVLTRDVHVTPVMAAELEWYVLDADGKGIDATQRTAYLDALQQACHELPIHSIGAERGVGQVEVALLPTAESDAFLHQLATLKDYATHTATSLGYSACFLAKPFAEDYGSGLHVHIHLQDAHGQSLYYVEQDAHEVVLSEMLSWSIGGLLVCAEDNISVFAGTSETAFDRYHGGYDAPIMANWGYNNRTTALRLPDSVGHVQGMENILAQRLTRSTRRYKRIEHRIASSEAEVAQVLTLILSAIYYGIVTRTPAPPPTYGNSYTEAKQLGYFNVENSLS